jgi:hypothetical protein
MHSGSRAICFFMALLAAMAQLVSAAFGSAQAKPASPPDATVTEVGGSSAGVVAASAAPEQKSVTAPVAKAQNFSANPMEMRITAHPPLLRVIANAQADSRQMASLADANERRLQFVKITLG